MNRCSITEPANGIAHRLGRPFRRLAPAAAAVALAFAQAAFAAGPVDVVSGGAGRDEYEALNAQARDYSLKIVTAARRSGAWLADVDVVVRSLPSREVQLVHVMQGPLLLAQLPPGQYEVTASFDDVRPGAPSTVVRRVSVGRGLTQMVLQFDTLDDARPATLSSLDRIERITR